MPEKGHQHNRSTTAMYPGNVTHLADAPLYLYPRSNYIVEVTVEQDPLKLYPAREMLTEEAYNYLQGLGILPEHIVPFLVQLKGVWNAIPAADFYPDPDETTPGSLYYWYGYEWGSDYPEPNDTWYFQLIRGAGDVWFSRRAFKPSVRIFVDDDEKKFVDSPDDWAVCRHHGFFSWPGYEMAIAGPGILNESSYDPRVRPTEAAHLYSPDWGNNPFIKPQHRTKGYQSVEGGGQGYEYSVTHDGVGKMRVRVATDGREIKLRLGVDQELVLLPQGFGSREQITAEHFDNQGPPHMTATAFLRLPFYSGTQQGGAQPEPYGNHNPRVVGFIEALSSATPEYQINATPWHEWRGGDSASDNAVFWDWTSMGLDSALAYAHTLGFGRYKRVITPPGQVSYRGRINSPLLFGADKLSWVGTSYGNLDYLGMFYELGISPPVENEEGHAALKKYLKLVDQRRAFERAYMPPKIKITVTTTLINDEVGEQVDTRHYYVDLPYTWLPDIGKWKYEDVFGSIDPGYDEYDSGVDVTSHSERDSLDTFATGTLGPGSIECDLLYNLSGLELTKRPGGTLGDLYEAPDDYIYEHYPEANLYPGGGKP